MDVDFVLRAQRRLTWVGIGISLAWSGLAGVPILGLWLSVWLIGLGCGGTGAFIHELEDRRRQRSRAAAEPSTGATTEDTGKAPARSPGFVVMVSGFGYLVVGMLAGWFPPVITVLALTAALADFASGHRVARRFFSD